MAGFEFDADWSPAAAARDLLPLLTQNAAAVDRDAVFPEANLASLRASGLLGLLVPQEYGGPAAGVAELVEVSSILASACLSTAMIWSMHCQQVDAIARFGTDELRATLLPRTASGDVYIASVTTEKGKSSGILQAVSPLRPGDGLLALEREAPIVTGGHHADGFLITMRASAEAPSHQVSLVYADREQLTVKAEGRWDPLGMRGTDSVGLRLAGHVPPGNVVGPPGGFREVAVDSLVPIAHLGWSACWLGTARAAFAQVVALAAAPTAPSGLDTGSDLVAERLARIRLDLETVGAYLRSVTSEVAGYRAAGRVPGRPAAVIHLNSLKILASELCFRAVDGMIALVGMFGGYSRDSPLHLERHFRDLRSAALNYSNSRLLVTNGNLALMDRSVELA